MALAASCLHLFAQSNWTGPPVSLQMCDSLPPALLSSQVSHRLIADASFCVVHHLISSSVCSLKPGPLRQKLFTSTLFKKTF